MKKLLTLIILFSSLLVFSQTKSYKFPHIVVGPMVEGTISGIYLGLYAGVNISKMFQVGAFYEELISAEDNPYNANMNTWGGYGQVTLVQDERLGVHLQLRFGYQSDKFVFLIPNILTEWAITNWFHLNFSLGIRNEYPSIGLICQFNIPLKK